MVDKSVEDLLEEIFQELVDVTAQIEARRGEIAELAGRRAVGIARLRGMGIAVSLIADRLGMSRQAIYDTRDAMPVADGRARRRPQTVPAFRAHRLGASKAR